MAAYYINRKPKKMNIYDFITFDNKRYDELSDMGKSRFDQFVKKIREAGLEEKLMPYINRTYDISRIIDNGSVEHIHDTDIPKDLSDQLDFIYHNLYD